MLQTLMRSTLAVALVATGVQAADTLHVPGDFGTIQAALDAAQPGDTVLVADGTWAGPGNRDLNFLGKNLVLRSVNGPEVTIIDAGGTPTEPHRGFVFENGESRASVVEGFTITGGATLPGAIADPFNGGGMVIRSASPTVRNCHFVGNTCGCWGAAIYSGDTGDLGGGAAPLIENCLFRDNVADDDGGGFFTWGAFGSPQAQKTVIRNSVFLDNGAVVTGGAIASFGGSNLVIENVTVNGNWALFGRGLYIGDASVRNSIVWGNGADDENLVSWLTADVTYSNIQGGAEGAGNTNVDPRFAADGYHLLPGSPLIDQGAPHFDGANQLDIDGQLRLIGTRADMGADEVARPRGRDGQIVDAGIQQLP